MVTSRYEGLGSWKDDGEQWSKTKLTDQIRNRCVANEPFQQGNLLNHLSFFHTLSVGTIVRSVVPSIVRLWDFVLMVHLSQLREG